MLKAIIFDFDGTILDTELPEFQAWQEIYREFECELPFDLWLEVVGTTSASFDPVLYLETQVASKKLPPIDWLPLRARRKARMAELIEAQAIRPGVVEMIQAAAELGLRLGVASSSGRDWVAGHLERLKLLPHFDAVCTGDEVERVKPDPALYRLALARLGVESRHALAIEDSRNGMLAAKGAGLRCVVTPNAITEGMVFAEADWCVRSLAEMALGRLVGEFGARPSP